MRKDFPAKRRNCFIDQFCCVGGCIIIKYNHFDSTITVTYQEHDHRKLRQACDAILQQFSSNGSKKSVLSVHCSL